MDKSIDWEVAIAAIVLTIIVVAFCVSEIVNIIRANKQSDSYACKTAEEDLTNI